MPVAALNDTDETGGAEGHASSLQKGEFTPTYLAIDYLQYFAYDSSTPASPSFALAEQLRPSTASALILCCRHGISTALPKESAPCNFNPIVPDPKEIIVAHDLPDGYWHEAFYFHKDDLYPDLLGYGLGLKDKPATVTLFSLQDLFLQKSKYVVLDARSPPDHMLYRAQFDSEAKI
ncbi:hypothetical protein BD414DRAFT_537187 [Trametes punicea]|nr:hypothetical protein BD414DRAFT_537187 [Trametes punicea]